MSTPQKTKKQTTNKQQTRKNKTADTLHVLLVRFRFGRSCAQEQLQLLWSLWQAAWAAESPSGTVFLLEEMLLSETTGVRPG